MEFVPVVEVVEIHGILESRGVILQAARGEDAFAGIVTVIVAADGSVQFFDVCFIELNAGLLLHPVFELGVAGTVVLDEIEGFLAVQTEAIEDHLVVALAAARVASSEFAARFERGFQPQARQVQNAQRTCGSGTNKRYDCIAHKYSPCCVRGCFSAKLDRVNAEVALRSCNF